MHYVVSLTATVRLIRPLFQPLSNVRRLLRRLLYSPMENFAAANDATKGAVHVGGRSGGYKREVEYGGWRWWKYQKKEFRSLAIIVFVRSAVIATRVLSIPTFSAG